MGPSVGRQTLITPQQHSMLHHIFEAARVTTIVKSVRPWGQRHKSG